jgi:hypothetical protein
MSIKKAMQTYARQGGTSSIFVHDDGLQLMPDSDREERMRFYEDHGIGWVARPKHDDSEGGFKRRGRFKKASNMNYGLALSLKMEVIIRRLEIERGEKASLADSSASSSSDGGEDIEEQALRLAVEEIYEDSGKRFQPWAHNAKALRVGEIILIVDSDTIVPEVSYSQIEPLTVSQRLIIVLFVSQDCFRDAARELAECPEVAIIQHDSGEYLLPRVRPEFPTFFWRRYHAGRTSLFREWHCSLYSPNQQVYLHGVRKWRSRAFCGAQCLPSLVCAPGCCV